jgi:hypothetical protein
MPSRRKALHLVGSTVSLGLVSGCLGLFQDGGIRIRIDNRDDQEHTVTVTFENGNKAVFSDQYTVSAGEETTTSDVVEPGEYLVTVEVGSSNTKTVDFDMQGCDSNTLFVAIDGGGELEASVLDEC